MEGFGSAVGGQGCGYLLYKGLGGPFECNVNLFKGSVVSSCD